MVRKVLGHVRLLGALVADGGNMAGAPCSMCWELITKLPCGVTTCGHMFHMTCWELYIGTTIVSYTKGQRAMPACCIAQYVGRWFGDLDVYLLEISASTLAARESSGSALASELAASTLAASEFASKSFYYHGGRQENQIKQILFPMVCAKSN